MRESKVLRADSKCPYDDTERPSAGAVFLAFDVLLVDFETKPRMK